MMEDMYVGFCRMCGVPDPATFPPPEAIPCSEFSDRDALCASPLVSVMMTTYNHAKWIRQAIEGVVCQRTDFEYELIIGDDASKDGTLEICREYQRRYPDRVRVLWAAENVYAVNGNFRRILHRVRGEYVAVCEGDDYWTDPLKLQKQIDLIRRHGAVGSVAFSDWEEPDGSIARKSSDVPDVLEKTDIPYFHTSTQLLRRNLFDRFPDIRNWFDSTVLYAMVASGPVCVLKESVSVYRRTGEGIWTGAAACHRRLMNLGMYLDLIAHGPKDIPEIRCVLASAGLRRIFKLVSQSDDGCREFVDAHRRELQEIINSVWRELPWRVRLKWMKLRLGRF